MSPRTTGTRQLYRTSILSSLMVVLLSLLVDHLAWAGVASLPLDDYWKLVEETRQVLKGAQGLPADQAHALLTPLADRWGSFSQVSLPDGAAMQVDNSYLVAGLRAEPPDTSRLEQSLEALESFQDEAPQAAFSEADVRAIQAVLARPEFQWKASQPSPWQQWWQRLRERFLQWLARLLARVGMSGALSVLPYLLTAAGLLVLFLILILALRNIVSGVVAESELGEAGAAGEEALTAGMALQKAQVSSGAGDYRTAVRYLYLSSLLLLEERGLLPYDRSRTNREYLRSLSRLPALAAILRDVVEVFDRVWYGYQTIDAESYDRFARRVEELQQQR